MTTSFLLVLIAIFGSVALIGGTLASALLTWSAPEQREIRRLSRRGGSNSVLAQLQLSEEPAAIRRRRGGAPVLRILALVLRAAGGGLRLRPAERLARTPDRSAAEA